MDCAAVIQIHLENALFSRVESTDKLLVNVDVAVVAQLRNLKSALTSGQSCDVANKALVLVHLLEAQLVLGLNSSKLLFKNTGDAINLELRDFNMLQRLRNVNQSNVFSRGNHLSVLVEILAHSAVLGDWSSVVVAGEVRFERVRIAVSTGSVPEVGSSVDDVEAEGPVIFQIAIDIVLNILRRPVVISPVTKPTRVQFRDQKRNTIVQGCGEIIVHVATVPVETNRGLRRMRNIVQQP